MTYNLLTLDSLNPGAVTVALAECLDVAVDEVDVGAPGTDPDLRYWDAAVSCELQPLLGDLTWSLDIYVQETVVDQPLESELAARFAKAVNTTVLFPAEEAPPSAYWVATPQGLITRARLEPSEDEPPVYTVTAVEAPVPQLPQATVEHFEEIVREQRPDSPVTDRFKASLGRVRESASYLAQLSLDEETGSPIWTAQNNLAVWERVITQMESRWAPSGWYPAGLYRERLEARDALVDLVGRLPHDVAVLLNEALDQLDRRFVAATAEDSAGGLQRQLLGPASEQRPTGWWWHRRPDPAPWEEA
ncbi:hypothetical protein [Streptomyces sp. WM6378]|uniref:hypothetical protein n=1 Tax=Streptomyces sp. WM6378 TaxID=1415557 RepID=UPI0006AE1261|nr:hypothetical protein [Streptomyces sp. WM6378]